MESLIILGLTAFGYSLSQQNNNNNSMTEIEKQKEIPKKEEKIEKFNIYNNTQTIPPQHQISHISTKPSQNITNAPVENITNQSVKHNNNNNNNELHHYRLNDNIDEPFVHNNMVPFFGTNVTQSIDPNTYNSKLGHYTGNFTDGEYKSKEEVSEMFKPNEQSGGNVYGMPSTSMKNRYNPALAKNNELPFEQIKVGSGLGLDYNDDPKGGYQQLETMVYALPRSQDETRTANNLQKSYQFEPIVGTVSNPDNRGMDFNFTRDKKQDYQIRRMQVPNSGAANKQMFMDSVQPIYNNNRITTSDKDYYATPGRTVSSEMKRAEIAKSKRNVLNNVDTSRNLASNKKNTEYRNGYKTLKATNKEMLSTKGGNDFRNVIYKTKTTLSNMLFKPRATNKETLIHESRKLNIKGGEKIKARNNQKLKRTIKETTLNESKKLNINSNRRLGTYHNKQKLNPTHKETYVKNENYGVATGTKKDSYTNEKHIIPVTNRQTMLSSYHGNAQNTSNDAYKIVDQTFIPRDTSKQQISDNDYTGGGNSVNKRERDREAEENMCTNEIKEIISQGREPKGSSVKQSISKQDIKMQIKKCELNTDEFTPIPSNYNKIPSKEGLSLNTVIKDSLDEPSECQSYERLNPEVMQQLDNNPYNLDISK